MISAQRSCSFAIIASLLLLQFFPNKAFFGVLPIEHACERFYPFPGRSQAGRPRAISLTLSDFALILIDKGVQDFLLFLLADFFPEKGEGEDPTPARSPIIGMLPFRGGMWWVIHAMFDVIAHILPEIVVDAPRLFLQVECSLRLGRKWRACPYGLRRLSFRCSPFFVSQRHALQTLFLSCEVSP